MKSINQPKLHYDVYYSAYKNIVSLFPIVSVARNSDISHIHNILSLILYSIFSFVY